MDAAGAGQMADIRAERFGFDVRSPGRHCQVLIVRLVFAAPFAVLLHLHECIPAFVCTVVHQYEIEIFLPLVDRIRCPKGQTPCVDSIIFELIYDLLWGEAPLAHDHCRVIERMIAEVINRAVVQDQFPDIMPCILGDSWIFQDPVQLDDCPWSTRFPTDRTVVLFRSRTLFGFRSRVTSFTIAALRTGAAVDGAEACNQLVQIDPISRVIQMSDLLK